jgi:hypothetical protein
MLSIDNGTVFMRALGADHLEIQSLQVRQVHHHIAKPKH